MKIKLAILEKDSNYLMRLMSVFETKYSDKLELYSFTDCNIALSNLDASRIDVLVASDAFEIEPNSIPKRCSLAYFVDSPEIDTLNGQRAICKFQKIDLIYKQILSIYSETAGNVSGIKFGDEETKIIAFQPVSGGCGSSTVAASCAIHFASAGKKVLYLNLEKFGSADLFFEANGQFDMSDIIFALKSKKANLALKLESCVKQDQSGVNFYSQSKDALHMIELNSDDILHLITELKITGSYDIIVVDMDFSIEEKAIDILKTCHGIVWVGDGSAISNTKLYRAYNSLMILEQEKETGIINRLSLIYNKFSNKTSKALTEVPIRNIGGASKYEHATTEQILEQLSPMEMFEKIL